MRSRPDVLVLGVGGVLGEAWMIGVLAGIEDATGFDLGRCEYFVGTSAGSIVAARLVAGERLRRPAPATRVAAEPADGGTLARRAARYTVDLALAASSPVVSLTLGITRPGGALARAAVLRRLPRPSRTLDRLRRELDESGAHFDGRLRIVAVDRASGRRIVFGSPRAPRARVGEAVEASCAVPWLFAPVTIAGREYVDGGVWSPTNLDIAPAGRDSHVLCLHPTAAIAGSSSLIGIARGVASTVVALETQVLRHRGASVVTVAPDHDSIAAIGSNLMSHEPRDRVLVAGYRQGLAFATAG